MLKFVVCSFGLDSILMTEGSLLTYAIQNVTGKESGTKIWHVIFASTVKIIVCIPCKADPSGRTVSGVGLQPFACWDCGFESRREHGCLSVVSVVCCQIEVSASDWLLVERSPTECGVSECDREASVMRRSWPTRGCCAIGKKRGIPCKGVVDVTERSYSLLTVAR
jgi:hypothetical protein